MTDTPEHTSEPKKPPANPIVLQLKQQQATIERQEAMIEKLTTRLTSPEYLQPAAVPEPPEEPSIETPQALLAAIESKVASLVSSAIEANNAQIMPLIKHATPESPVWQKTQIAEQLVRDGKVADINIALELAESRLAKETEDAKAKQADLDKASADLDAAYAGVGGRATSSLNHDRAPANEPISETLERNWQKADMDAALKEYESEVDPWGLPENAGVQVVMEETPD